MNIRVTFKQTVLSTALLAGSLLATTLQAAETLNMSIWVPPTHFVYGYFCPKARIGLIQSFS